MDRGAWRAEVPGVEKESDTTEVTKQQQHTPIKKEIKSYSIWPLEISLTTTTPHRAQSPGEVVFIKSQFIFITRVYSIIWIYESLVWYFWELVLYLWEFI